MRIGHRDGEMERWMIGRTDEAVWRDIDSRLKMENFFQLPRNLALKGRGRVVVVSKVKKIMAEEE